MRAYIPPNYDDDGGYIGGIFDKRRAIDAGVYLTVIILLLKLLSTFGAGLIVIVALFCILGLPVGVLLLFGINEMPISTILYNKIVYKRTRRCVTLRPPNVKEGKK